MFTDNLFQYKNHAPFSALEFSWRTAFQMSSRFTLIPSIYGRVLMGKDVPFPKLNMVGGKYFGRYLSQQMPFDGIWYMESAPNSFLSAKIQARERFGRRHYASASFNYALAHDDFRSMLLGKHYFGASVDYGYDLRNFPLQVSLTWSNVTRSPGLYVQAGYVF
jgi:NTE family protein